MIIQGVQKLTLLDYPEKLACTVFTHGCNFRCPFCHNASLVTARPEHVLTVDDFFEFLKTRVNLLDGVCVTGGEPLLQKDISEFIARVKSLGFTVKLDTNGSFPKKLRELVTDGLVDYVAMDIKSSPEGYASAVGIDSFDLAPIRESVSFLLENTVEYEFRTTVVDELHCSEDFISIGKWLRGAKKYYLQQFVDSGDLITDGLHACSAEQLRKYADILKNYVDFIDVRGI